VTVRDTRLLARSVTQRWPMSPEIRKMVVAKLLKVMTSGEASPREITSAAKALMSAEKQNQEDEHKLIDVSIEERDIALDAIASDLGITIDLIADAQRQSGGSDSGTEGD